MEPKALEERLAAFQVQSGVITKGPLCVALAVTRMTAVMSPPYNADDFLTPKDGQVRGLGKGVVQKILADHGIQRVLAEEGGRTSRGSIKIMREYVAFLNELHDDSILNHAEIETWWIERVHVYFASAPLKVKLDSSRSVRSLVVELLDAAFDRQRECPGTMVAGAVLQHLVGAKLECALPDLQVDHSGFSVADAPTGRKGDFLLGDTAIHVTTAPSTGLISKCASNLAENVRPVIVTTAQGAGGAVAHARDAGIHDRIDILEIDQFVATNIYEWSAFSQDKRSVTVKDLVSIYNRIIDECETDPSLKIDIG